ncbi:hypothetical protein BGZ80_003462 [Entomortierella chlamydospora]|uniref:Autophagy-related protein 14 n=1 Tax=Entomortierella chlamydospora TaxID=101097 RepID=A0A9P6MP82_9FUNG|nr:hypothetical protein BGZ80_003462 [Entomortierella chlamydospora]
MRTMCPLLVCTNTTDHLLKHWEQLDVITTEKDKLAAQANQVLSPKIKRYQMCLAQRAMAVEHAAAILEERKSMLAELEQDRQKLIRLRTALHQRKETLKLSKARLKVSEMNGPPKITSSIERIMKDWAIAHQKLGHSRRVLVAELVTLFDLKCVPERRRNSENYNLTQSAISTATTVVGAAPGSPNAKDGRQKTKLRVRDYLEEDSWNEYLIVGRPLPTGFFENYDRDEINTTIENVIHMMKLVACYLGIKLPFDTFIRQSRYYIQAALSSSSKRAPLFLSDSNIMLFAAGLGYLNYNIAYLCHSQGVHITLANAANTLENLLACCEATNLGRYTNYAAVMTKRPENATEASSATDEIAPLSPVSYEGDYENIKMGSKKAVERNEHLLWCPGQDPFDLNVIDLIALIRSRREEESPVWGGVHLQDAVAANLETLEDDYFMQDDHEEEDGMYDYNTHGSESGSTLNTPSGSGGSVLSRTDSSSTLSSQHQRRPPHPSRDRRQSHSESEQPQLHSRDSNPTPTGHAQPENWTFLDVDISRVPSSVSKGSGLLSGRGWPDISVLKKVGSAVGGAAVGFVNGASNVAAVATAKGSRQGSSRYSSGDSSYSTISSSAP